MVRFVKDVNGKELNDVCFNCSSQTAKDNQKEVHTAEIYLTVRSANQIYSADKKVIITNHDPGKKDYNKQLQIAIIEKLFSLAPI